MIPLVVIAILTATITAIEVQLDISSDQVPDNLIKDVHLSPDISNIMFIPLGYTVVSQVNDKEQVIWKARPGQTCSHFRVYSLYGENRLAIAKISKVQTVETVDCRKLLTEETKPIKVGKKDGKRRPKSESYFPDVQLASRSDTMEKRRTRLFSDSTPSQPIGEPEEQETLHFENLCGTWSFMTAEMYKEELAKLQCERKLDLAKEVSPIVFTKNPCDSFSGRGHMIVPYTKFKVRSVFYNDDLLWSANRINHEEGKCEYAVIYEYSVIREGKLEDVCFVHLYISHGLFFEHLYMYKMGSTWTTCSYNRFFDMLVEYNENVEETKF
ncbi:signal peptide containing protein [Theileria equi strain WA]|uniref:Signal peptide containing protein n=1 Tax=Theileria equi strain WA TaxID=1537102 RepID=L1LDX3_THEEQ|nr:signal peptide containing protein [Theileria equi strain WA]EKX73551.1 signal peptide containing protein [Theileria equi strain WA]|eukprot:XP_004833003.1 signal peptide containing protein [Theileria equi strain WA]